jgi:uncharacterized repeat protein (TIGR03843 family)
MMRVLEEADLVVLGRLADASNLALLVRAGGDTGPLAVYKPVRGERPLWDFPDGTLAAREVAAYVISATGGWDVVPETVLRVGPHGIGSVQRWVGDPEVEPEHPVDVVAPDAVPEGWLPVLEGEDGRGRPVLVVHEDSEPLRAVAAFDAVINNSDRKGSHLVREDGELRGFDHGVSLHEESKLRTVLWGFAGQPLSAVDLERIGRVLAAVEDGTSELRASMDTLITPAEVAALEARCRRLLARAAYPVPSGQWPSIPWPPI